MVSRSERQCEHLALVGASVLYNTGVQKNSFIFSRYSSQKPHVTTVFYVLWLRAEEPVNADNSSHGCVL